MESVSLQVVSSDNLSQFTDLFLANREVTAEYPTYMTHGSFENLLSKGAKLFLIRQGKMIVGTVGLIPRDYKRSAREKLRKPIESMLVPSQRSSLSFLTINPENRFAVNGRLLLQIVRSTEAEAKKMGITKLRTFIGKNNPNWRVNMDRAKHNPRGYSIRTFNYWRNELGEKYLLLKWNVQGRRRGQTKPKPHILLTKHLGKS